MKFGGSSVANPERIKGVLDIIRPRLSENLRGVVFSAYSGITDKLIHTAVLARKRDTAYRNSFEEIKTRHVEYFDALINPIRGNAESFRAELLLVLNEVNEILDGVYLLQELSPRSLDFIQGAGERLSCLTITALFLDHGIDCEYVDARELIKTNDHFTKAILLKEDTYKNIRERSNSSEKLWIITGFIGSTASGESTTLGRGGSDFTASVFGAALDVEEIEIWTDVDGVLTTDPRKVKSAQIIDELSYAETMELSYFGAKVVYAPTIQPAQEKKIPIRIKNTFNPTAPGTLIKSVNESGDRIITGIACIENIALIRLEGSGLVGAVGFAGRLFGILSREGINIILISQASSEHSICFAVNPADGEAALAKLKSGFSEELKRGDIEEISCEYDLSVIAVVGENMRHKPGISGKIFNILGTRGINISAIAQGSSELNISMIVRNDRVDEAISAIHDTFFEQRKVSLYLAGPGKVGSHLLSIIQKANHASELYKLSGIINSRKMVFKSSGIPLSDWKKYLSESSDTSDYEKIADVISRDVAPVKIFVDATASEEVTGFYGAILQAGADIVSANKIANAGSYEIFRVTRNLLKAGNRKFKYETNVGAALPVISVLQNCMRSGDRIHRIRGVLSGSVNYVLSQMEKGMKFNEALTKAADLGLTEPDPKVDFSGLDVARKLIIVARECGYQGELSDVLIENFIDENSESGYMDVDKLYAEAKKENKKLKYIAEYGSEGMKVSIEKIDSLHEFYNIDGRNNAVSVYTDLYNPEPLVVKGYGAGIELTASGVFSDIVSLID